MLTAATEHNDNEMAETEAEESHDAENGNGNGHEDESTENPEQVRLACESILNALIFEQNKQKLCVWN